VLSNFREISTVQISSRALSSETASMGVPYSTTQETDTTLNTNETTSVIAWPQMTLQITCHVSAENSMFSTKLRDVHLTR
jgi:hypothetical protein